MWDVIKAFCTNESNVNMLFNSVFNLLSVLVGAYVTYYVTVKSSNANNVRLQKLEILNKYYEDLCKVHYKFFDINNALVIYKYQRYKFDVNKTMVIKSDMEAFRLRNGECRNVSIELYTEMLEFCIKISKYTRKLAEIAVCKTEEADEFVIRNLIDELIQLYNEIDIDKILNNIIDERNKFNK